MPFFVYVLISTSGSTYVGATVDLDKRLRKHNKEIKGGARATGKKVNKGEIWKRYAYVQGFPTWNAALQFEWRWKQLSRQLSIDTTPIDRRMKALDKLMALDRSTKNAVPFCEWENKPAVVF